MKTDYEKDVSIDPDALDVEWLEQSRLMIKYSTIAAQARKDADWAKENLEIIRAELDKEIRSNPEEFGLEKITESAITNTIVAHQDFKDGQEQLRNYQYEYSMSMAAVRAIEGKKDALENLVRLHGQQYFAGPKVPRNISYEWEQKNNQREANKRVRIKRKN